MVKINSIPKFGDTSSDVLKLQEALRSAGYFTGPALGNFRDRTLAAVKAFQKSFGSTGSGVIGPVTLQKLELQVVAVSPVTGEAITQDIQGKQDRHLHPSLRLDIESGLFPNKVISDTWKNRDLPAIVIEVDKVLAKMKIVEEGGNNKGKVVGMVQGTTGKYTPGGNGDAWCFDYHQVKIAIIEDFFKEESPVLATAHVKSGWNYAIKIKGLTTQTPTVGSMAMGNYTGTESGHIMGIIGLRADGKTMDTSEGNTSIKSLADGNASGLKTRNIWQNGKLKTMGFMFIYPYNQIPKTA